MQRNHYLPATNYLQNVMSLIWQVDGFPNQQETIIPKGVVEIIFDFGENIPVQAQFGKEHYQLPRVFINGFNTSPIQLQHPQGHTFFGVQLHTTVIKSVFGVRAQEFANRAVDLTLVDPFFAVLWQHMAEQNSFEKRVALITSWLESKRIDLHPQDKMLHHFLDNPDQLAQNVTSLAKTLCYSPRHLSRKIYALTEMNTEELLSYKKYLYSIQLMHHSTELSLTEIAYASNFSDQSHFIKSFKTFAQLTPGEYRNRKSPVPGHLYENVR